MSPEFLINKLPELDPNGRALIERAYHKAEHEHKDQHRKSGEPYFTHCFEAASILADMRLDAETIAAALMHDIVEDTDVELEELEQEFGPTIAKMVDGVTKMAKVPMNVDKDDWGNKPHNNRGLEYIRKMLLAMDDDIRVILIKLADRLHNMRTLGYMPAYKQQRTAKETMEIYAPLANRLGIWQMKWELEDLSFRYLDPSAYKIIVDKFNEHRTEREEYVNFLAQTVRDELDKHGIIGYTITARPKHFYSIHKKMQRKDLPFSEIYDINAIRIIVETMPQCYLVLGLIHSLWHPILREFDDYIALPKSNQYQSLHTAVRDGHGKTLELQIRTKEMHEQSEYGVAAHWRYKEGNRQHDKKFEQHIKSLHELMELGPDVKNDPETFLAAVKTNFFEGRVYAYTPKGDIIDLPTGATPIDFAYHIHTDIGHRCRGARVDGKLVSLNYELQSGDRVEIITCKRGGPSMDWLTTDLGYVKTPRVRAKIRHYFRKLDRDKHIDLGRDVVERELKRMGVVDSMSIEDIATIFHHSKLDSFLGAVGAGEIDATQLAHKMLEEENERQKFQDATSLVNKRQMGATSDDDSDIKIMGVGGLFANIAACCNPMPGDDITGYITRGRGVTVHRRDCPNILSISEPERLIDVSWGSSGEERLYAVPVEIIAYNRSGLIRDISTVIADEKVNIAEVQVASRQEIATFHITMEISNNQQLTRILSKIGQIRSVVETYRCNSA